MKTFKSPQTFVILAACVLTIALRLIESPLPNFSSVVALSLLCGAVIRHPAAILLPLAVRLITDLVLHVLTGNGFFGSWPFDYSAYVLICLLGFQINPRKVGPVLAGTAASVALYFLVSNFGVWLLWPDTYERSISGLLLCYSKAIPFVRGSVYGNALLAPIFFAAWNLVAQPQVTRDAVPAK